jgi:hypothetical protein
MIIGLSRVEETKITQNYLLAAQRPARQPRREFTEIGFNSSRVT